MISPFGVQHGPFSKGALAAVDDVVLAPAKVSGIKNRLKGAQQPGAQLAGVIPPVAGPSTKVKSNLTAITNQGAS